MGAGGEVQAAAGVAGGEIAAGEPVGAVVDEIYARHAAKMRARALQVVVSGAIGAGKSSTISVVAARLRTRGLRTHVVRELLPENLFGLYLADPARYALEFQIAMAHLRAFHAYDALYADADVVLHERCAVEDAVFFRTNRALGRIPECADGLDTQTVYEDITHEACVRCLETTDLFVLVDAPLETTIDRMVRRDRAGEREAYTHNPYFAELHENYQFFHDGLAETYGERVLRFDNSAHSPLHVSAASLD